MMSEKLSKFEIRHLIAILKNNILSENTSTSAIRYDVKLIDKLEVMLGECDDE